MPSFKLSDKATLLHDAKVLLFEKHSALSPVEHSE